MCTFLDEYSPRSKAGKRMNWFSIKSFAKSMWYVGLTGSWLENYYYWKTLVVAVVKYREAFPEAVAMLVYGFHLRKIADKISKS